jgi:hypothetical protein
VKVELSNEELNQICTGLVMRCNYIESSNPILSGADAAQIQEANRASKHGWRSTDNTKPNVLTYEQMELVVGLRKLIERLSKL